MGWKYETVTVETMDGKLFSHPTQSYYECDECHGFGKVEVPVHDSSCVIDCTFCGGAYCAGITARSTNGAVVAGFLKAVGASGPTGRSGC